MNFPPDLLNLPKQKHYYQIYNEYLSFATRILIALLRTNGGLFYLSEGQSRFLRLDILRELTNPEGQICLIKIEVMGRLIPCTQKSIHQFYAV